MLGGVGYEVIQHLDDAPLVRPHPRQVQREIDLNGVSATAAQERVRASSTKLATSLGSG